MKKIMCFVLFVCLLQKTDAQLADTKWKTTLPAQPPVDVIFSFSADSLNVLTTENYNLETLKYTVTDSVLTLQKLYGQTGCDTSTTGSYVYKINTAGLLLTLITDNCNERAQVLNNLIFTKAE